LSYAISEHALNDDNSLEFIISKDIENAINKAIKELPDSIRETFMLNRYNQMTYKEIAVHLSISEKTVEYRISRALKDLRSKLSPYNYMLLVILSENVVKSIKETL
jgi:RNA polymerase sigma-70 factor (ECF subfamily)